MSLRFSEVTAIQRASGSAKSLLSRGAALLLGEFFFEFAGEAMDVGGLAECLNLLGCGFHIDAGVLTEPLQHLELGEEPFGWSGTVGVSCAEREREEPFGFAQGKISLKARFWCGREDSNLHALRR